MKETKELVVGLLKVAVLLADVLKDGAQVQDVAAVIAKIQGDEVLKAALLAAYNDIELVKEEMKDIDAVKGLEVAMAALPEIAALIKAVAKK